MPEITSPINTTRFVFRPEEDEKSNSITNQTLQKMARDENLIYELIGGEIIVSTAPGYIHQLLATRIIVAFSNNLEENPVGEILTTPGLIFSEFDGVIPDLIYISHERIEEILDRETGKFYGAPEIVIEILSPGRLNARRDLQIKRELYEIYEVPEYWVVKPLEKEIVQFKRSKGKLIENQTFNLENDLKTKALPELSIKLEGLFSN